MYNCNRLECFHNKNGICLGECEEPCDEMDWVVISAYMATDQLKFQNHCFKYSKLDCVGCPEKIFGCQTFDEQFHKLNGTFEITNYNIWLCENYGDTMI